MLAQVISRICTCKSKIIRYYLNIWYKSKQIIYTLNFLCLITNEASSSNQKDIFIGIGIPTFILPI